MKKVSMKKEDEKNAALIRGWKEALFDGNGPGGIIEMDDLDSIMGGTTTSLVSCSSCCPKCTQNC